MTYQPQLPLPAPLVPDAAVPADGVGDDSDWRIDEPTRRAGRRGVAAARAALARSAADTEAGRAAA